jgi:hypothetical protein
MAVQGPAPVSRVAEEQYVLARLWKTMISIIDSIKRPGECDAYILNARLYGNKEFMQYRTQDGGK